jgi:hypothetical protein
MPSWKASLARRTAALMARFFARSAHDDDRHEHFRCRQAAARPRAREARALTFSSLVDACGRALVGFAVRQPQATAVLPLVAPWALRIIARTVVIVRPSSLFRACLGTLAHELLESRPASVAAVWAGVSGRRGRSRRLGHDWGGFSDRIGGRRPEERVLFGHWSAYRARRGEGRFQPRNGLTPTPVPVPPRPSVNSSTQVLVRSRAYSIFPKAKSRSLRPRAGLRGVGV